MSWLFVEPDDDVLGRYKAAGVAVIVCVGCTHALALGDLSGGEDCVLGRGGDVGLEAAIQSIGTGLSRALLTQVDRESATTQGSRGYY